MTKTDCTDRVVGAILASWRYDISGISPEMRKDYEQHFSDCVRCSARQKFHRGFDVALVVLTSLSVFFSLFALAALRHVKPLEHVAFNILGLDVADAYHMLVSAAVAGVLFSVIAFVLVLPMKLDSRRAHIIENTGLYWHFVDLVWIFLFPLLYLF